MFNITKKYRRGMADRRGKGFEILLTVLCGGIS